MPKRREFLAAALKTAAAAPLATALSGLAPSAAAEVPSLPALPRRFSDLRRHFVFEYYPWYAADPWRHWDQWDRAPPLDLAANYIPALGPYDSRSASVLERHARWIVDSGAGAVNVSWWGPGSFEDRTVPLLMDVMRAHDLKVAFHMEPYADDHALHFAEDVLYLLREYGERRGWDAFLLLQHADGRSGPVFKGFRTLLPEQVVDCHGVVQRVEDWAPDTAWRRQCHGLRRLLSQDFDHFTLLADTLDVDRAARAGFDGIAIYDNFVAPDSYARHAAEASAADLLFSFNVNPGYDGMQPRNRDPGSCYVPPPFAPPAPDLDWSKAEDRERAARLSAGRVAESLAATLAAQSDPASSNGRRGFFLAYLNSFNEWHEGHSFEPMKAAAELLPAERALGYHNPEDGGYRLVALSQRLGEVLAGR